MPRTFRARWNHSLRTGSTTRYPPGAWAHSYLRGPAVRLSIAVQTSRAWDGSRPPSTAVSTEFLKLIALSAYVTAVGDHGGANPVPGDIEMRYMQLELLESIARRTRRGARHGAHTGEQLAEVAAASHTRWRTANAAPTQETRNKKGESLRPKKNTLPGPSAIRPHQPGC